MFLDSSVLSILTISPGAQRGDVDAERVHGHPGDPAPVADPPERAGVFRYFGASRLSGSGPVHLRAQRRLAAVEERGGPPVGVEADVVRAEHAVDQDPADLAWKHPVVVRRRPRGVREVGDADIGA